MSLAVFIRIREICDQLHFPIAPEDLSFVKRVYKQLIINRKTSENQIIIAITYLHITQNLGTHDHVNTVDFHQFILNIFHAFFRRIHFAADNLRQI